MRYPTVLPEVETLELAHGGLSIARFGDGELKIALGRDAKSQRHDPKLESCLRDVLKTKSKKCLVCIPNILPPSPKAEFWKTFSARQYVGLYDGDKVYGSSFITRPDSAPWINTPSYWERVTDLWRGRDVVLVRGSSKSLTKEDLTAAATVEEIIGPRQHAWDAADGIYKCLRDENRRVLLCLGATATVMAWRLAYNDVHALDLGHLGMFARREGRFDRESFPA